MNLFSGLFFIFLELLLPFYLSILKSDKVPPNILLIITDDMGKDATRGYKEGVIKPKTPTLDSLTNSGIRFTNFYTNPSCSSSRASILTGKYSFRTGVLSQENKIDTNEISIQHYINEETNDRYATAIVGKWNLSGKWTDVNGRYISPDKMGVDYFAGFKYAAPRSYYNWNLTKDGIVTEQSEYISEVLTNLAIEWVQKQSKPWFLWLAYTAPHTPFHIPPSHMHYKGNLSSNPSDIKKSPLPYYLASIEAIDYQINKFIKSLSQTDKENLVVIIISDNGTTSQVAQSPYFANKVKGTLYQGGINCPMIVCGKNVIHKDEDHSLINSTDLFATIASIAGVEINEINDSKNFSSLFHDDTFHTRKYIYSEFKDKLRDEWCLISSNYKLIVHRQDENKELYNLHFDPYEERNLLLGNMLDKDYSAMRRIEDIYSELRSSKPIFTKASSLLLN